MKSLDDYGCASVPAVENDKPAAQRHTPGPWVCERIRLDGHEWAISSVCRNKPPYHWMPRLKAYLPPLTPVNGKYVDASGGSGSTDAGRCAFSITENEANARLIAAAPDLLEAALHARMCVPFPSGAHHKLDSVIRQIEGGE